MTKKIIIIIICFLGCDICNEKHDGECPMHGPLHSLRKLVNAGQSHSPLENGSILKFPDEVCLCTSSIPCVGYGVCARKRIPAGTWIGPYEGKLVRPEDIKVETETEYMWEVGTSILSTYKTLCVNGLESARLGINYKVQGCVQRKTVETFSAKTNIERIPLYYAKLSWSQSKLDMQSLRLYIKRTLL